MKVTKTSIYTNRKNTMEINITEEDYQRWKNGEDIDDLLTYDEREFLRTGATPEEVDTFDEDDQDLDMYDRSNDWDW